MRMLRTHNSFSESITQQIGSVSTEQSQTGCEQFGLMADEKGQEIILEQGESASLRLASGNRLRENIQDFDSLSETSIHKGSRTRIGWYEIQDRTYRGRRLWRSHPSMPGIHTSSSKPTFQSLCSNSWRNSCWTSHLSSLRTSIWHPWT